jgi:hypothetical protein
VYCHKCIVGLCLGKCFQIYHTGRVLLLMDSSVNFSCSNSR